MNKYSSTIIALLFINGFYSQDSLKIRLDDCYQTSADGAYGIMKVLECPKSGGFYYAGKPYQFKFPNDFSAKDSAIAFNYFTGWENAKLESTTLLLFGNHKTKNPFVYVDYNHNLDFTDDGPPIVLSQDSTFVIYLKNSKYYECLFPIKLFYPDFDKESRKQIETYLSSKGNDVIGNHVLSVEHWIGYKRMNYRLSETQINGKTKIVGLFDSNCNGLYNDIGKDRIIIVDGENFFVHRSNISGEPRKGDKVQFEKQKNNKGWEAVNVVVG